MVQRLGKTRLVDSSRFYTNSSGIVEVSKKKLFTYLLAIILFI